MPNLRLYRAAWVIAIVLAASSLLALRSPAVIDLSEQPSSFDAQLAYATAQTVVEQFPSRTAGSDADNRTALWLSEQIQTLGLEPHVDSYVAEIEGSPLALQNVWTASNGRAKGAVLLVAARDSPPGSTQGADDNASGIAVLLELARVFTAASHDHPIIYLWSDGDSYGALGARQFVELHPDIPIIAVVTMQRVGHRDAERVTLNGWSVTPRVAPPWLWILGRSASRADGTLDAALPRVSAQLLRLAVPISGGSQAPFVAEGVPAISISLEPGPASPATDTIDEISADSLGRAGRTIERMTTSLDAAPLPSEPVADSLFISRYRALRGSLVQAAFVILTLPLAFVVVDLWARARRSRLRVGPAWLRLGLRLAPWYLTLVVVYLANLLSLLPHTPGAIIPPGSAAAQNPRYLRVILVVLILAVTYHFAMKIEHRLALRHPHDREPVVLVAHTTLLMVCVLVMVINPFSLLLLLPAALLWPLARPGTWAHSRLPAWAGLAGIAVAAVYFASQLQTGWKIWWYLFVLLENRTIPPAPILMGIALVAATALLGHDLHETSAAARAGAAALAGAEAEDSLPETGGPAEDLQTLTATGSAREIVITGAAPSVIGAPGDPTDPETPAPDHERAERRRRREERRRDADTQTGEPPEGGPPEDARTRRRRRPRSDQ